MPLKRPRSLLVIDVDNDNESILKRIEIAKDVGVQT
jgi:hypothetical protein